MKILFISDLNIYSRGLQRLHAFSELGHEVVGISHTPVPWNPGKDFNLLDAISWRFKIPIDSTGINKKIKSEVIREKFDVIWIEKGNTVKPATLCYIKKISPETKLISFSEDDMHAKHNHSFYYVHGLKYYDLVLSTKTYNLDELKLFGARRTELFMDAYDEKVHRPHDLTPEEKAKFSCDVGFIGSFEGDRANRMLYLAENGIKVAVWGLDWERWIGKNPNLDVKGEHLFGEDYSKAICATKINLCFLRKINRDLITSRSVEIPACGAFMLGERTNRHLQYFEEGKEAEFFGSNEEMLAKAKHYLQDDAGRAKIASAGRERCLRSGYSHKEQLKKALSLI